MPSTMSLALLLFIASLTGAFGSTGRLLSQTPSTEGAALSIPSGSCSVVINEIVHKPEDIGGVKGVDFVELFNPCDEEVDLTNWSLSDEDATTFVMGQDGCAHIIGPMEFLVLFRNNPCSFEFGYTGIDKATLMNGDGDVVMEVAWDKDDANRGRSWAAIPDGSVNFLDGRPTPGVSNEEYIE